MPQADSGDAAHLRQKHLLERLVEAVTQVGHKPHVGGVLDLWTQMKEMNDEMKYQNTK